jgi:hypothetical protein
LGQEASGNTERGQSQVSPWGMSGRLCEVGLGQDALGNSVKDQSVFPFKAELNVSVYNVYALRKVIHIPNPAIVECKNLFMLDSQHLIPLFILLIS